MSVNPENVDLTHIEDVTDIKPAHTLAISDSEHRFGPIGHVGKRLLAETPGDQPIADRVFGRLGEKYAHATWKEYDLFWAEDEDSFIEALEEWQKGRSL